MARISSSQARNIALSVVSEIHTVVELDSLLARVHETSLATVSTKELHAVMWKTPAGTGECTHSVEHSMSLLKLLHRDDDDDAHSNMGDAYHAYLAYTTNGVIRAHADTCWFPRGLETILHTATGITDWCHNATIPTRGAQFTCIDTQPDDVDFVCRSSKQTQDAAASKIRSILASEGTHVHGGAEGVWGAITRRGCQQRHTKFIDTLRVHAQDAGYPIAAQIMLHATLRLRVLISALIALGLAQIAEAIVGDTPNIPFHTPPAFTASALCDNLDEFEFLTACTT